MFEDESGRLRLTGSLLGTTQLATGAIIAALGTENSNGDFEVIDIKVPDLPRQPNRWERDEASMKKKDTSGNGKIAFVSGLGITGTSSDNLALELLTDYLLGYTGSTGSSDASTISRLIIAGNSLGSSVTAEAAVSGTENTGAKKKAGPKKYGYDASAYNPSPITHFDAFLAEILPSIPVTLMPGDADPANFSLPQQGIHRAMLPRARAYCAGPTTPDQENPEPGWLDSVTNPWEGDVEGWRVWGSSGQNVDDVLRYLDFADDSPGGSGSASGDEDSDARVKIMEAMLRWRCGVPTAPDTLCTPPPPHRPIHVPPANKTPGSYPFQSYDPFVLQSCPHIFFAGNQPRFKTAVVEGDSPLKLDGGDTEMTDVMEDETSGPRVRLLAIPRFCETGELVLVDAETLEVEVVRFGVYGGAAN